MTTPIRLHQYPALAAALCFGGGIGLSVVGNGGLWTLLPAAVACTLVGAGMAVARGRVVSAEPLLRTLGALLLTVAAGAGAHRMTTRTDASDVAFAAVGRVTVEGVVDALPAPLPGGGSRFVLRVRRVRDAAGEHPATGRLQVTLNAGPWGRREPFPTLREADGVRLTGRLAPAPSRRNPADFDARSWLARQGIHARLTVTRAADVAPFGRRLRGPDGLVVRAREAVLRRIDSRFPNPTVRPVMRALLLGDRTEMDRETDDAFARTGLLHILAVS